MRVLQHIPFFLVAVPLLATLVAAQEAGWDMPDPGPARQLTVEGGESPIWLAGGRIAFIQSSRSTETEDDRRGGLYLATTCKNPEISLWLHGPIVSMAGSADGKHIVVLVGDQLFDRKLVVLTDGKDEPVFRTPQAGMFLDIGWLDTDTIIYTIMRDGTRHREVYHLGGDETPDQYADILASMPVGRTLSTQDGAYRAVVGPSETGTHQISIHDTHGQQLENLTQNVSSGAGGGGCFDPAFDASSQWLAYTRSQLQPSADVFVRHMASGQEIAITSDQASNRNPSWSPQGDAIVYESQRDGRANLWIVCFKE